MSSVGESMSEARQSSRLGEAMRPLLREAPVYILAFVLLSRPMISGLGLELKPVVLFGMLLLGCGFFWVCGAVVSGTLRWRAGSLALVFLAFMGWMLLACTRAHNLFAAAEVWWLFATYGLTAFLVLQLAGSPSVRWFFLCCILATVVTLAAYALLHLALYVPAWREWLRREPEHFRLLFDIRGPLFQDLVTRAGGARAVGNFLTSNQLGSFLLLGLFPLGGMAAGLLAARRSEAPADRTRLLPLLCGTAGAGALALVALVLSGSKGALLAFVFGALVFALGAAGKWMRRHAWKLAGAASAVLVLCLVAVALRVGPAPERFAASLGVRVGYWRASARMIQQHPLLGIGPGCWKEHYTILKAPEFEETKLAHNAYLQVWTETGTAGLLLFVLFWGLFAAGMLRGVKSAGRACQPVVEEPRRTERFSHWGLLLGGGAMALNWGFIGTFNPPEVGVPKILTAAPWLIYLGLFAVWAATFHLLHNGLGRSGRLATAQVRSFVLWGLVAGAAAFLLHSAAEFTFRVPAVGATAFALAALLVMAVAAPRQREVRLAEGPGTALLLCVFAISMAWALVASPRAMDYGLRKDKVFALKRDLIARTPGTEAWLEKAREIAVEHGQAVKAVPWDDESWHDRAGSLLMVATQARDASERAALLAEAEKAARKATQLNRLKAAHWRALGDVLWEMGRHREAVDGFRRGAHLHPSLPESWLTFAAKAEQLDGLTPEVCAAYKTALENNGRQYHPRNKLEGRELGRLRRKVRQCDQK